MPILHLYTKNKIQRIRIKILQTFLSWKCILNVDVVCRMTLIFVNGLKAIIEAITTLFHVDKHACFMYSCQTI